MRKTKTYIRKISNITLLGILIIIVVGVYYTIFNSKAEDTRIIGAIAQDIYGLLEDEDVELEARSIGNSEYVVDLPEAINTKIVKNYSEVSIEDTDIAEGEEANKQMLTIENNQIKLAEEDLTSKKVMLKLEYDVRTMTQNEDGSYEKTEITQETIEEIKQSQPDIQKVYNKLLKYEDKENQKVVEVRGLLPEGAELQIQEVGTEEIQQLITDKKITVAYDIKIAIPEVQEDGTLIFRTVNPSDYDENCEVKIEDSSIQSNSQIYHIDDNKQVEEVQVKENAEQVVKFDANEFSIYAVATASENENVATTSDTINFLKSTSTETSPTSGFLGNTNIQRQNIESVTFKNKLTEERTFSSYGGILEDIALNCNTGNSSEGNYLVVGRGNSSYPSIAEYNSNNELVSSIEINERYNDFKKVAWNENSYYNRYAAIINLNKGTDINGNYNNVIDTSTPNDNTISYQTVFIGGYLYGEGGSQLRVTTDCQLTAIGYIGNGFGYIVGTSTGDLYKVDTNLTSATKISTVDIAQINSIMPTSDGGFVVGGTSSRSYISVSGLSSIYATSSESGIIVKYNSSGAAEWGKFVEESETVTNAIQTSDGGYLVSGECESGKYIIKYDSRLRKAKLISTFCCCLLKRE